AIVITLTIRARNRPFQFSLRSLLLFVFLAALPLAQIAWTDFECRKDKESEKRLSEWGVGPPVWEAGHQYVGPIWLERIIDREPRCYFSLTKLWINDPDTAAKHCREVAAELQKLHYLKSLGYFDGRRTEYPPSSSHLKVDGALEDNLRN